MRKFFNKMQDKLHEKPVRKRPYPEGTPVRVPIEPDMDPLMKEVLEKQCRIPEDTFWYLHREAMERGYDSVAHMLHDHIQQHRAKERYYCELLGIRRDCRIK